MDADAAIALGLVWLVAATLKLRGFTDFVTDIQRVVSRSARPLAVGVLAIEAGLGLALLLGIERPTIGVASIVVLEVMTASFVLRALKTSSLDCACFATTSPDSLRHDTSALSVLRDCARPALLAIRNGLVVTLAGIVAAVPAAVVVALASTVVILMGLATVCGIVVLRAETRTSPHPRLARLIPHRRRLFASAWHADLHIPWMTCLRAAPPGPRPPGSQTRSTPPTPGRVTFGLPPSESLGRDAGVAG